LFCFGVSPQGFGVFRAFRSLLFLAGAQDFVPHRPGCRLSVPACPRHNLRSNYCHRRGNLARVGITLDPLSFGPIIMILLDVTNDSAWSPGFGLTLLVSCSSSVTGVPACCCFIVGSIWWFLG
jgi:hypothetical protein